jgi:hypothetical protein
VIKAILFDSDKIINDIKINILYDHL